MSTAPIVCDGCGTVLALTDLVDPSCAGSGSGHVVPGEIPDLCGPAYTRFCLIDGCAGPAALVVVGGGDPTEIAFDFCDKHRYLYRPRPWDRVAFDRRPMPE